MEEVGEGGVLLSIWVGIKTYFDFVFIMYPEVYGGFPF